MIQTTKILIILSPLIINPIDSIESEKSKYAKVIPYEALYEIPETPNKGTMEYNPMSMEEITKRQNKEMLKKTFQEP